ncbi:MAG: ammonium transporter [Acidimicrobiales bacterium]|nr:ammonium transporter [Acidimicrobiales bacterium]
MDTGDAAWVLTSSALVLFMTPGLALFYGGMDRSRNVLNMLMMNFWCLLVIPLVWVIAGFSLAYSGAGSVIGNFDWFFLSDLTITDEGGGSTLLAVIFLGMFAVITPALISGAVADRMKFSAWALFVPLWLVLVYCPVSFWIYGGVWGEGLTGWLGSRGSLDFAGGTVIHVNAGIAALAGVLALGKRKGWPGEGHPPHSMPLVMLGTGILWFGWFGFNAGSAFAANGVAIQAFMNTFLAAAAAGLAWAVVERIRDGHFTNLGVASGIVAGLVAITPGAGFVAGMSPIWIGLIAGIVCSFAVGLKFKAGYDDALDVVGVHFVGGLVGSLLIGLFADPEFFGGEFKEGLFYGGGLELLGEQALANGVVIVFSFVVTFLLFKVLDATLGIRVSEKTELTGLDLEEHSETAYHGGTQTMERM